MLRFRLFFENLERVLQEELCVKLIAVHATLVCEKQTLVVVARELLQRLRNFRIESADGAIGQTSFLVAKAAQTNGAAPARTAGEPSSVYCIAWKSSLHYESSTGERETPVARWTTAEGTWPEHCGAMLQFVQAGETRRRAVHTLATQGCQMPTALPCAVDASTAAAGLQLQAVAQCATLAGALEVGIRDRSRFGTPPADNAIFREAARRGTSSLLPFTCAFQRANFEKVLSSAPFSPVGCHAERFQITTRRRGFLEDIAVELQAPAPLGRACARVSVLAVGLNFRDVLSVLGMYPGDPGPIGGDFSGVIAHRSRAPPGSGPVAVGDRVFGIAGGGLRASS